LLPFWENVCQIPNSDHSFSRKKKSSMKEASSSFYNPITQELFTRQPMLDVTSYFVNRIWKRHALKIRDLININNFTASSMIFLSETGFFFLTTSIV
jgi:hypothetical protein